MSDLDSGLFSTYWGRSLGWAEVLYYYDTLDTEGDYPNMAIPSKKELRRSILEIVDGAKEDVLYRRDIVEKVIEHFSLTSDDILERIPAGNSRLETRLNWALYELKKAGFLSSPSQAHYQITPQGKELLATDADSSDTSVNDAGGTGSDDSTPDTPEEEIQELYKQLRDRLAEELLESVKRVPPADFELLVLRLLEKMGYGKGKVTGQSGDGGIDGIINQDTLGLEKVYIQAKRWENQVGEPAIRNFAGSFETEGANKGVFITSSSFSKTANGTADKISAGNKFIRLIDGAELARLMIDHGVGVVTKTRYYIKKLDENYFAEFA